MSISKKGNNKAANLGDAQIKSLYDLPTLQAGAGYLNGIFMQTQSGCLLSFATMMAAGYLIILGFLVGGAKAGFILAIIEVVIACILGGTMLLITPKWKLIFRGSIALMWVCIPLYWDITLSSVGLYSAISAYSINGLPVSGIIIFLEITLLSIVLFAWLTVLLKHQNYERIPSQEVQTEVKRLMASANGSPEALLLHVFRKNEKKEEVIVNTWHMLLAENWSIVADKSFCCFLSPDEVTLFDTFSHRDTDATLVDCKLELPGSIIKGRMLGLSKKQLMQWKENLRRSPDAAGHHIIHQIKGEWWPAQETRMSKASLLAFGVNLTLIMLVIWFVFPWQAYGIGLRLASGGKDGNDKRPEQAIAWLDRAAKYGTDSVRMAVAAKYLEEESDIPKRPEKGVQLLRPIAENGNAKAACELGFCYYNGDGVPEDKGQAIDWFRKAAEQGSADAEFMLGLCYFLGDGVPEDKAEGINWLRKAAAQGLAQAEYRLGECYRDGYGVAQDKDEACNWYRKAAAQGLAQAEYRLGVCYRDGEGVPEDKGEALNWFRKAAEQGDEDAQAALDELGNPGSNVEEKKEEGEISENGSHL